MHQDGDQKATCSDIDPQHQYSIASEMGDTDEDVQGHEQGEGKPAGQGCAPPEVHWEVPYAPDDSDDKSRRENVVMSAEARDREARPSEFLDQGAYERSKCGDRQRRLADWLRKHRREEGRRAERERDKGCHG